MSNTSDKSIKAPAIKTRVFTSKGERHVAREAHRFLVEQTNASPCFHAHYVTRSFAVEGADELFAVAVIYTEEPFQLKERAA